MTYEVKSLNEECGIFGIWGHPDAAKLTYFGLHSLQHRGQEGAGILSNDAGQLKRYRDTGLLSEVFRNPANLDKLTGTGAMAELRDNGQIFTQYVDFEGKPSMDSKYNPNGSVNAIEGITSKNGQIIGKMGHSERFEDGLFQNIPGNKDQHLFASAVKYFTGK